MNTDLIILALSTFIAIQTYIIWYQGLKLEQAEEARKTLKHIVKVFKVTDTHITSSLDVYFENIKDPTTKRVILNALLHPKFDKYNFRQNLIDSDLYWKTMKEYNDWMKKEVDIVVNQIIKQ